MRDEGGRRRRRKMRRRGRGGGGGEKHKGTKECVIKTGNGRREEDSRGFQKRGWPGSLFYRAEEQGPIPEPSEWKSDNLFTQGMAQILPAD